LSTTAAVRTERSIRLETRPAQDALAHDRAACAEMLPLVSRTFALSIEALPVALRDAVRSAYLLCRIVDTVEDDAAIDAASRARLFDTFDALCSDDAVDPTAFERLAADVGLGATPDERRLCTEVASATFRCFRALAATERAAIRPHVLEMARGMREFSSRADRVGKLRLGDLDELERYCYFVAGTVGKLLTALFERAVPSIDRRSLAAARARAVSFGIALQLVNIVKDVAEDLERGDCFLPTELCAAHGLSVERLLHADVRPGALAVVRAVCARAREHLARARAYTLLWPVPEGEAVRLFCAVPLALALATLVEVERGADTLCAGRTPKVSRELVAMVFGEAVQAVGDDARLERLFDRCTETG
jgi:farnesyl-diphosphate farnesyltransferase